MSTEDPNLPAEDELDRLITASAAVQGLEIRPDWRPQVRAHLAVAVAMAALVQGQALPDEAEPLPVFAP